MAVEHVNHLIVGGGVASAAAARTLRRLAPGSSVTLVAAEQVRPYHRPPLSKAYLRRDLPRTALPVNPANFYREQRVTLRTGTRATALDTGRGLVTLDTGEQLAYDRLLIAAGAKAGPLDVPGAELPGLWYLRTLEDSDRLHTVAAESRRDGRGRCAVVGGGRLGVELAASLANLGLAVTLFARGDRLWPHAAGEHVSRVLKDALIAGGVDVRLNDPCVRLEGDGRVQRAVGASSHTAAADFAVAAVGAEADLRLVRGTGVQAERAVLTDEFCRTSADNVYAAGDCAKIFDPRFAKHRHLDHWDHAGVSGTLAATNMAAESGAAEPLAVVNWFFTQAFDVLLNGWGEPRLIARRLVRGAGRELAEIGVDESGRVCSALAIGRADEHDDLRALVDRRADVAGREEQLKDPAEPLLN